MRGAADSHIKAFNVKLIYYLHLYSIKWLQKFQFTKSHKGFSNYASLIRNYISIIELIVA